MPDALCWCDACKTLPHSVYLSLTNQLACPEAIANETAPSATERRVCVWSTCDPRGRGGGVRHPPGVPRALPLQRPTVVRATGVPVLLAAASVQPIHGRTPRTSAVFLSQRGGRWPPVHARIRRVSSAPGGSKYDDRSGIKAKLGAYTAASLTARVSGFYPLYNRPWRRPVAP